MVSSDGSETKIEERNKHTVRRLCVEVTESMSSKIRVWALKLILSGFLVEILVLPTKSFATRGRLLNLFVLMIK